MVFAQSQPLPNSFSFVVFGHIRSQEDGRINKLLDELLDKIRKTDPDLAFITGDMIWGFVHQPLADSQVVVHDWQVLDEHLARLGIPVYRVPGNHDINDPVTRDIFFRRYGNYPKSIVYKNNLFLLLNSAYVPKGNKPSPKYILTSRLDSNQVNWIKDQLSKHNSVKNVFLFMHHVHWWSKDASWWKDVHPILKNYNVRAVFSGDFGPMKFTHLKKDGIHYLRTTIDEKFAGANENVIHQLRASEENRNLLTQFDNFLYIEVQDTNVSIDVRTVGALSTGNYSPEVWEKVHGETKIDKRFLYDPDKEIKHKKQKNLISKFWKAFGSPFRMIVLGGVFTLGLFIGLLISLKRQD